MKKVFAALTACAFVAIAMATVVSAQEKTITGKLMDQTCAGDGKDEPQGADSDGCALSCAKRGVPLVVIAKDGMYEVTGAYAANKNEKSLPFVAKNVTVKGTITEKDGKKTIVVTSMSESK